VRLAPAYFAGASKLFNASRVAGAESRLASESAWPAAHGNNGRVQCAAYRVQQPELMDGPALELSAEDWNRLERLNKLRRTFALFNPQCWNIELKLLLTLIPLALNAMFRFVTIIPLHFWVIVLLLLLIWAAFGLGGLVVTAVGIMFFG
jgi:hypothetical protein